MTTNAKSYELNEREAAVVDALREERERHAKAIRDPKISHVSKGVMTRATDDSISVPQTNDHTTGATFTNQFGMAWAIVGTLAVNKHITPNLTDPGWANKLEWLVTDIAQTLIINDGAM